MKKFNICLLSASILILTACGSDSDSDFSTAPPTVNPNPEPDTSIPATPIQPGNNIPTADAGTKQNIVLGDLVTLDGSKSVDEDEDALTYTWTIKDQPKGSKATLSDSAIVNPTFKPDVQGKYIVVLVVNDGNIDSKESTVEVNAAKGNASPVAVIKNISEEVQINKKIVLDGSLSTDSDNDTLSYNWTVESKPSNSVAQLSMSTSQNPSIIFDKVGAYKIGLVVSDGQLQSEKTFVAVEVVRGNSAPLADAGAAQTIKLGNTVTLDGSKSTDPDNDKLNYKWSVSSLPSGSKVTLNSTSVNPVVRPDIAGSYVFNLKVSDGFVTSSDNVNITVQSAPELVLSTDDFFGSSVKEFPYSNSSSFNINSTCVGSCAKGVSIESFALEAKGSDFTITNLKASSSNTSYPAFFEGLNNNQIIKKGEKLNFDLRVMYTKYNTVSLNYSFTVKETGQTFSYNANGKTN
ncbi:PKD domain-containing protein [Psychrobacter cibarius]|uniref:PKD domain-containing protein n=1 Tax=Psychrobacter cibarius TaxID=282669 RepID=UPI0018DF9BFC|nr:PKD domain-containing protein [Psychrobacter cibarius]